MNEAQVTCTDCGQEFNVALPEPLILNHPRSSIVATCHEEPTQCICGRAFVLFIQQVQLAWNATPISEQQAASLRGSDIIIPSNGHLSSLKGN